jgi:hypothetical protein
VNGIVGRSGNEPAGFRVFAPVDAVGSDFIAAEKVDVFVRHLQRRFQQSPVDAHFADVAPR